MGSIGNQAFSIPTIDLSGYLRDCDSLNAEAVVEEIRSACATSGFFQLAGHGISNELQQQAFAAANAFFDLPEEEKCTVRSSPGRGYEIIGSQSLEPGKKADLKESFFIGNEIAGLEHPPRPFREPNVWPTEKQVTSSCFKSPLQEYHQEVLKLSLMVMQILTSGMKDFDTDVFQDFCREPIASLRLLRYPRHSDTDDDTLVGTGAHTDFGAITLLLQDGNSGLQVFNRATNEWFDVAPRRDAYVVNVGDMLNVWTGGLYKSTVHRVINRSGSDRYSIPFFLDGNPDCRIQSLAKDGEGGTFTVEEHMMSRYSATYT